MEFWIFLIFFFLYCAQISPVYSLFGLSAMSSSVILVKLFARVASLDWSIRFIKGCEIKFSTKEKKESPLLADSHFFVFPLMRFSLT